MEKKSAGLMGRCQGLPGQAANLASMTGRNELCPCGSGKKYKKCCLELHERIRRQEALAGSIYASFVDAVNRVHGESIKEFGVDAMDNWSRRFQGGDPETEIDIFREFVACHVPFEGFSSQAAWTLERTKLTPAEHRVLTLALEAPYSIWEISEIDSEGRAILEDLLTGTSRAVLSIEDLREEVGSVLLAKIVLWENTEVVLSYSPFFALPEEVQGLIEEVLGGQRKLSSKQLLEPEKAAEVYLAWLSLVWDQTGELDLPESFGPKIFHRFSYSFDSRKEGWLHQALRNSPDFVHQKEDVYAYPDGQDIQAVLSVGKGTARADCIRVDEIERFHEALRSATGELLRQESAESVNLLEHLFTRGLEDPILPGMPSLAALLSPDQLEQLTEQLDVLREVLGNEMEGDDELEWVPSIDEVIEGFLDDRAQTVSEATFRRDERAMQLLRLYLVTYDDVMKKWSDPREYLRVSDYEEMLSRLPGFFLFVQTARIVRSETEAKGTLTSVRVFIRWLRDLNLLSSDEIEELMEAIASKKDP